MNWKKKLQVIASRIYQIRVDEGRYDDGWGEGVTSGTGARDDTRHTSACEKGTQMGGEDDPG